MEIVYLLDDSIEFTDAVKEQLDRRGGFDEVVVFNDVDDFKEHMNPDVFVAIVDYNMPKMNGLQITRYIKSINNCCLVIIASISNMNELPPSLFNEEFMGYVGKDDDHQVSKIIELARLHFAKVPSLLRLKKRYE